MKKNISHIVSCAAVSILLATSSCKKNLPDDWKAGSQHQNNEVTSTLKPPPGLIDVESFHLVKNTFEIMTDNTHEADLNFLKLVSAFRTMSSIQYDPQHKPVRASLNSPDSVCQFSYDIDGRLVTFLIFVPAPPPGVTAT